MRDRRLAALLIVLAVAFLAPARQAGAAEDVTAAELRELAARAENDPEARRLLAEVRRVDGRPVDVAAALGGADEGERQARLKTLSEGAQPVPVAGARDDARRILEGRRYNPAEPPRPLRGVLRRLGGWLRPLADLYDRAGLPPWAQLVLALAVLLGAAALAARSIGRRRAAVAVDDAQTFRGRRGDDPVALEREADDAERRGAFDLAVRLRFRAGLLRLDAVGAVELRPSLTTGELRRSLRSEALRELTITFDAVAYAGEHADADDVAAARRDWPRVLQEVGQR